MAISKLSTTASLKQVMDKFEEISLQDFSSIDVITASKLPANGKEGQLCIITDTTPNSILFNNNTVNINETEILVLYYDVDSFQEYNINASNINIKLFLRDIVQKINGVNIERKGYIYLNGKWKSLLPEQTYIFKSGVGLSSGFSYTHQRTAIGSGSTSSTTSTVTQNDTRIYKNIQLGSNSMIEYEIAFDKSNINLSGYKNIHIDFEISATGPSNLDDLSFKIQIINPDFNSIVASSVVAKDNFTYTTTSGAYKFSRQYTKINVEYLTGEHIIKFISYIKDSTTATPTIKTSIYNIVLGDEYLV